MDGAEPRRHDVLGAVGVLVPDGEQRRDDRAVATARLQAERGRGDQPLVLAAVLVDQDAEVAAGLAGVAGLAVPDAHGQREPLQDDRVVGEGVAVALEPDDQVVAGAGGVRRASSRRGPVGQVAARGRPAASAAARCG